MILFRDAAAMVDLSPNSRARVKTAGAGRNLSIGSPSSGRSAATTARAGRDRTAG
jgi:hypothetical protein